MHKHTHQQKRLFQTYRVGVFSQCWTYRRMAASILNGILFSHSGLGNGNSYNKSLSIEDDGFSLFLKPLGVWLGWVEIATKHSPRREPQSTTGNCLLSDYNKERIRNDIEGMKWTFFLTS